MNIWYNELVTYINSDEALEVNSLREYFNNLSICYTIAEFIFSKISHLNPQINKKYKDKHFTLSLGCDVIYEKSEFMLNALKHGTELPTDNELSNFNFLSTNMKVLIITKNMINLFNSQNVYSNIINEFDVFVIQNLSNSINDGLKLKRDLDYKTIRDLSNSINDGLKLKRDLDYKTIRDLSNSINDGLKLKRDLDYKTIQDLSKKTKNVLTIQRNPREYMTEDKCGNE